MRKKIKPAANQQFPLKKDAGPQDEAAGPSALLALHWTWSVIRALGAEEQRLTACWCFQQALYPEQSHGKKCLSIFLPKSNSLFFFLFPSLSVFHTSENSWEVQETFHWTWKFDGKYGVDSRWTLLALPAFLIPNLFGVCLLLSGAGLVMSDPWFAEGRVALQSSEMVCEHEKERGCVPDRGRKGRESQMKYQFTSINLGAVLLLW